MYFDAKKKEEFAKFHGKLKGAIVIYQEPASLSPPKPEDPNANMCRPMQAASADEWRTARAPIPFAAFMQVAKERETNSSSRKELRRCCAIRTSRMAY